VRSERTATATEMIFGGILMWAEEPWDPNPRREGAPFRGRALVRYNVPPDDFLHLSTASAAHRWPA